MRKHLGAIGPAVPTLAVAAGFAIGALAAIATNEAVPPPDAALARSALARVEAIEGSHGEAVAYLRSRVASLEHDLAAAEEVAHERRAALAGELRREMDAKDDGAARAVAGHFLPRLDALDSAVAGLRRDVDAEAQASAEDAFEWSGGMERLDDRVAALEARRPDPCRCGPRPTPAPAPPRWRPYTDGCRTFWLPE